MRCREIDDQLRVVLVDHRLEVHGARRQRRHVRAGGCSMPPRSAPTPLRPPVENCTMMSGQCLRMPSRKRPNFSGFDVVVPSSLRTCTCTSAAPASYAACVDSICSANGDRHRRIVRLLRHRARDGHGDDARRAHSAPPSKTAAQPCIAAQTAAAKPAVWCAKRFASPRDSPSAGKRNQDSLAKSAKAAKEDKKVEEQTRLSLSSLASPCSCVFLGGLGALGERSSSPLCDNAKSDTVFHGAAECRH